MVAISSPDRHAVGGQRQRRDEMRHHRRGVAGDHLDADPGAHEAVNRFRRRGLGRVEKRHAAGEDEVGFVIDGDVIAVRRDLAPCHRQQAIALPALVIEQRVDFCTDRIIERRHRTVRRLDPRAQPQQRLRRALRDHGAHAGPRHQHRGAPALEVERQVVEADGVVVGRWPGWRGSRRRDCCACRWRSGCLSRASHADAGAVRTIRAEAADMDDPRSVSVPSCRCTRRPWRRGRGWRRAA